MTNTCWHWGVPQATPLKDVDLSGAKREEPQPWQPLQGNQAASLLVSNAIKNVCGGVPTFTLTMYVGLCINCLAQATGATDFRATRLVKYWDRALSSIRVWITLSSQDIFLGLKGEHGLDTWNTFRVEALSDGRLQ